MCPCSEVARRLLIRVTCRCCERNHFAEYAIGANAFLFASFDGECSSRSQTYAGKSGARFTW